MEVLQTSALPLGDGAGRSPVGGTIRLQGKSGRVHPSRPAFGCKSTGLPLRHARLALPGARVAVPSARSGAASAKATAPQADFQARAAEWVSGPHGAERAVAARGRVPQLTRVLQDATLGRNGAGNGIRTRDFDLGKVALYH